MTPPVTTRFVTRPRDRVVHATGVAIAAAIFLIDLSQPLGNAIGMLYILVIVRGLGTIPDWHPGAGEMAWFFTDEIIVR